LPAASGTGRATTGAGARPCAPHALKKEIRDERTVGT
jgi:hypothetical protein